MAEPSAPAAVVPAAPAGGEDEDGVFGWFSDLQLENIDAESFGDCPLFMDEKDLQKPENAPMVEWLSSLQYDGMDPLELALELKERANKALKGQPVQAGAAATKPNPRLAITIYDDALCQKCGDSALEAVIWANRAQAHFKLRNWGHVMHDCVRSIRLNKAAVKPYWRGAQAALKLKKFTECLEFCSEGQKVEPANAELQEIAAKATAGRAELEAEVAERDAEEKEVARVQGMMRQLLELRKVQLRPRPEWLDGTYHLDLPTNEQVYVDEASCLHWAVGFLYPEHAQSDLVQDVHEDCPLIEQLQSMFPPAIPPASWDEQRKYILPQLVVLYEAAPGPDGQKPKQRWRRVKLDSTLRELVSQDGFTVPGFPIFHVVAEGSPFAQQFLDDEYIY